jgi:hypothetical protein
MTRTAAECRSLGLGPKPYPYPKPILIPIFYPLSITKKFEYLYSMISIPIFLTQILCITQHKIKNNIYL